MYDLNLVDEIWKESRPKPPNKPIRVHDLKYAGVDVVSKLSSLRAELVGTGSSAIIISMLDEVVWLLNLVLILALTWLLVIFVETKMLIDFVLSRFVRMLVTLGESDSSNC